MGKISDVGESLLAAFEQVFFWQVDRLWAAVQFAVVSEEAAVVSAVSLRLRRRLQAA